MGCSCFSQNAVVDNIRITGPVFPEVNLYQEKYSCYTLYLSGDESTDIYNSYFSGSRAAAYVEQNAYIYNTVFEGGALANAILRCKYIVLDDVTTLRNTITTEDLNGSKLNLDNIVSNGLGLGFYIESNFANEIKIVLRGDLRQYNWIDTGLRNEVDSGVMNSALENELKDLVNKATTAGMIHSIGDKEYVNTGFAFAAQVSNIESAIVDMRPEEVKSQAKYSKFEYTSNQLSFTGTIYSLQNTSSITSTSDRFMVTDEYKMPRLESMEVSPSIRKVNPLIEETQISDEIKAQLEEYSFDINEITGNFNVKLPQGKNFIFTNEILREIVNVKLYNEDLTAFVQLVVPNGEDVDGSTIYKSVDSIELTRANHTAVFAAKISVSNRYDANGNPLATNAMTYYFEFEINATFDLQKATSNIKTDGTFDTTGTDGNFMYLKYTPEYFWDPDYLTAAYLFKGMTITDYMFDENGNEVSYEVDFSNITVGKDGLGNLILVYKNDDTKLGVKAGDKHPLQISAFSGGNMSSPSSYSIKVYDDGRIMIHSVNGADDRNDGCDMQITFTYKCNNNKDIITLKRVYDFKGTYGILNNKCDTPTYDRSDYGV